MSQIPVLSNSGFVNSGFVNFRVLNIRLRLWCSNQKKPGEHHRAAETPLCSTEGHARPAWCMVGGARVMGTGGWVPGNGVGYRVQGYGSGYSTGQLGQIPVN